MSSNEIKPQESNQGGAITALGDFLLEDLDFNQEETQISEEDILDLNPKKNKGLNGMFNNIEEDEDTPTPTEEEDEEDDPTPIEEEDGDDPTSTEDDDEDDFEESQESVKLREILNTLSTKHGWDSVDNLEIDGEVVPFNRIELTEDILLQVVDSQLESSKEKLLEGKVSTEGVSDFTKSLIEIEKNGGDIRSAIDAFEAVKNPIERANLDEEGDQEAVVYIRLKQAQYNEEDILDLIDKYKTQGTLKAKATKFKQELDTAFNKHIDRIKDDSAKKEEARVQGLIKYKETLQSKLKEFSPEFKPAYVEKLVDVAAKEIDKNKFELDTLYNEAKNNPDMAVELLLFLADKDEYVKHITSKATRKVKEDNFKSIKIIKGGKTTGKPVSTSSGRTSSKDEFDLTKIYNK